MRVAIVTSALLAAGSPYYGAVAHYTGISEVGEAQAQAQPFSDQPEPARPMLEGERAPDGLYYIRATIAGESVDFAVDSGASAVVLRAADARRLNLSGGGTVVSAQTAGGVTPMRRTQIDRLRIGEQVLDNVEAAIGTDAMPVSLLGQSALSRFDAVTFKGDRVRFH